MGNSMTGEEVAILKSTEIPYECRKYISHHVRNGLLSIMGAAMRLRDEPDALEELEDFIRHIAVDLEKVGL